MWADGMNVHFLSYIWAADIVSRDRREASAFPKVQTEANREMLRDQHGYPNDEITELTGQTNLASICALESSYCVAVYDVVSRFDDCGGICL